MKEHTKNLVNAFGFLKIEEAELLMQTAEKLKVNAMVVNIGAGVGTSALAVIEQRPDLAKLVFTIDARDDDNPFGGLLNERNAFRNANMTNLLPNQIKSDSSTAGLAWEKGNIDLLIIDADHTYEGVVKDINAWIPHLVINGFVAFHDYDSKEWVAVKTAVDEFVEANPEYELVGHAGTMIVYKKGVKEVRKPLEQKQETVEKETKTEKVKTTTTKSSTAKRTGTEKSK